MKSPMHYFKSKIKALRGEYTEPDKARLIKEKNGQCELCRRKSGESAVFGPTHYIKKKILFNVQIHIHKVKSNGVVHKIVICDSCHLSYHLYGRLDSDAMFGDKTVGHVHRMPNAPEKVITKYVSRRMR